jgi:hypothetical protein
MGESDDVYTDLVDFITKMHKFTNEQAKEN